MQIKLKTELMTDPDEEDDFQIKFHFIEEKKVIDPSEIEVYTSLSVPSGSKHDVKTSLRQALLLMRSQPTKFHFDDNFIVFKTKIFDGFFQMRRLVEDRWFLEIPVYYEGAWTEESFQTEISHDEAIIFVKEFYDFGKLFLVLGKGYHSELLELTSKDYNLTWNTELFYKFKDCI
ncbi:MAG: hypothetical protein IH840_14830 [Candidatus Heimdallarchaeota archaeon]|nr:hypothetical protein [Candidatus Heimdallarchaeota archaeon]